MRYRELKIYVNKDRLDNLTAELMAAGFDSLQIDDPSVASDILEHRELYKYDYLNEEIEDFAKNAPEEGCITLWFSDDEEGLEAERKAAHLVQDICGEASYGLRIESEETEDDSEWLYKWQEHFRPAKVGGRVVVKPSWECYEPAEGELVIEMDPGMAFGSGLHETTSMCIKALEKYMIPGAHVLDVGTGTGILAIAAVLLGADECLGIDIDDEAVRVSMENVIRNGCTDSIRIAKGDLTEGVSYDAEIIVANLMADLVMRLSPAAAYHLRPGGIYITSGILDIKEETVADAIRAAGFEVIEVLSDGEWRAIVAVKE